MERLTARDKNGNAYYPKCFKLPCEGERSCCTYTAKNDCSFEQTVLDRIAAYEDTELTPDEIQILKNHIELLERERQWIPVEDRLPEAFDTVLITAKHKEDAISEVGLVYEGGYKGRNKWVLFGVENPQCYDVLAWKSLPEPYEEG